MSYFDSQKPTQIIMDASPVGLGGLLIQDGKVISYASRTLNVDIPRQGEKCLPWLGQ